jgi:hypothetical protein
MFVGKILGLHIPGRRIAIVNAQGEGEVRKLINYLKESFGDLSSSPYRDRLFVLYDRRISTSVTRLEAAGVRRDNIVVLSKNGIEYYYPPNLLAAAFRCDVAETSSIPIGTEPTCYGGHRCSKIELARFVVERLTDADSLDPEIKVLLARLRDACQ